MTTQAQAIKLIELPSIDSTSSDVMRRLQAGEKAPFAVRAAEQTAGRGRRGHDWVSPVGNLFITLALKPPVESENLGLLPLKAAVVLAKILQECVGLRVTLKWPNDLLFAGRKLGGLLCELSSQGGAVGELLVGIGINVASSPDSDLLSGGYAATSLQDISQKKISAEELGRFITERWLAIWDFIPLATVPKSFSELSPGFNALWSDGAKHWYIDQGIGPDGTLQVARLASSGGLLPEPVTCLTSSDHGLKWIYQGDTRDSFGVAVADIGNSMVKMHFFVNAADRSPTVTLTVPTADLREEVIHAWVRDVIKKRSGPFSSLPPLLVVHALSVNPAAALLLKDLLARAGAILELLPKRRLRSFGSYPLNELGIDRLALIEGVLGDQTRGEGLAIVVGAGTAITIDAICLGGKDQGLHLGGLILPGVRTALSSLHAATALLPDLSPPQSAPAFLSLGQSTASAMRQGVLHACIGAVRELSRNLTKGEQVASPLAIFTCGGDGELLAPLLMGQHEPALLSRGAKAMILGG